MKTQNVAFGGCLFYAFLIVVTLGAWLTHVITTIQSEEWVFLLAGAIFAPIGIVHGIGIWFGFF